ncbi:MAG: hypothetical protein ABEI52_08075 [Halobacteriaceae archaeon]
MRDSIRLGDSLFHRQEMGVGFSERVLHYREHDVDGIEPRRVSE